MCCSAHDGITSRGRHKGAARAGWLQEPQSLQPQGWLHGHGAQHWHRPIWPVVRPEAQHLWQGKLHMLQAFYHLGYSNDIVPDVPYYVMLFVQHQAGGVTNCPCCALASQAVSCKGCRALCN